MKYIFASVTFLALTPIASALTLEMVPVGNPGNAPDTRYLASGVGSVSYSYLIGKYEITASQYAEFLNAVAKSDPNGLYNEQMSYPARLSGAGIVRLGTSPNLRYGVDLARSDRPVVNVKFWNAARFCNWLHNGQPVGEQGAGTTESGAYHDIGDPLLFGRNPGARYFIPTDNEWYKAAYHNKLAGLAASYFDYPTGTNVRPANDITEGTLPGNNVNYYMPGRPAPDDFYGRTKVGDFELSDSPYGTFDQAGNVAEWSETSIVPRRDLHFAQGGDYASLSQGLHAMSFGLTHFWVEDQNGDTGFRVASIPEPSTLALLTATCVGILTRRRKSIAQNCA